jgi:hypothetical protein
VALSSRDRRALGVFAGVIIAAAAAGAYFFFFTGGGGEQPPAAAPVTQTPTTTPRKPAKADKPPKRRPPTFAFFGGRDPFVPLVVAATGGAGSNTSGAINAVDSPTGGAQAQDATVVGGHNVSLIDVSGDRVQVSVDGQTYSVRPGEEFDGNFELVSVSGGCANFLFGDQSFTLCEAGARK